MPGMSAPDTIWGDLLFGDTLACPPANRPATGHADAAGVVASASAAPRPAHEAVLVAVPTPRVWTPLRRFSVRGLLQFRLRFGPYRRLANSLRRGGLIGLPGIGIPPPRPALPIGAAYRHRATGDLKPDIRAAAALPAFDLNHRHGRSVPGTLPPPSPLKPVSPCSAVLIRGGGGSVQEYYGTPAAERLGAGRLLYTASYVPRAASFNEARPKINCAAKIGFRWRLITLVVCKRQRRCWRLATGDVSAAGQSAGNPRSSGTANG
jgi:hypothetical protein